jgi:hypothetical protein
LDIADERLHAEPSAMHVGRERTSQAQAVGPGLLLGDCPLRRFVFLRGMEIADQLGPLDSRFRFHHSMDSVEVEHAIERQGIEQDRGGRERLRAHCVATAGD